MQATERKAFIEMVGVTLKMYRAEANLAVLNIWWVTLSRYELHIVEAAFYAFLSDKKSKFQPNPADIIEFIEKILPDGRPGADEAWAMIPRDEYVSAVMSDEMLEAYGIAKPLLDEGDQVAARMAFKDSYNRISARNKMAGIAPKWFPSLGRDPTMREAVLAEAVRLGRLSIEHASVTAPEIGAPTPPLTIEDKYGINHEKAVSNIARLKQLLGTSRIGIATVMSSRSVD